MKAPDGDVVRESGCLFRFVAKRFRQPMRLPLASFLLALAACDSDPSPVHPVYVVNVADQEDFRIALATAAQRAEAESLLASGRDRIVHGRLARGDGGFNAPYHWHLVPESVTFVDQTIEACSGRPMSDVEADLDYWVDTLGTFCPWGARIVRRIRP